MSGAQIPGVSCVWHVLAADAPEPDLLARSPRRSDAALADRGFWRSVLVTGVLVAAVSLTAFVQGYVVEGSLERGRTYAFSTLVVAECLRALVARSQTRLVLETGLATNLRLSGAVALALGLQLWSHHSSALGGFLQTGPLEIEACFILLALGAVPATVLEVSKLVRRRRRAALAAGSEVVR